MPDGSLGTGGSARLTGQQTPLPRSREPTAGQEVRRAGAAEAGHGCLDFNSKKETTAAKSEPNAPSIRHAYWSFPFAGQRDCGRNHFGIHSFGVALTHLQRLVRVIRDRSRIPAYRGFESPSPLLF